MQVDPLHRPTSDFASQRDKYGRRFLVWSPRSTIPARRDTPTGPRVVLNIGYDDAGRETSLSATVAGTLDFLNNSTYDANSQLTQVTQQGQSGGNTVAAKLVNFAFDHDGRLTTLTRYANLAATQLVATSTYGYDANANITSLSHDKLERRFARLWQKFAARPPLRIRIIAAPPGEAPRAICAAWIGCVLRLVAGTDSPQFGNASRGIVSGQPAKPAAGYGVPAREAILALEQHDPAAAQWWPEHAPGLLQPGKVLVFAAAVCEPVGEE
jgi:hypothetical protein